MIVALLVIVGIAFVLWLAVRWDLNRRHRAMINAAKVAHVRQVKAQVAEIDAKYPGTSRRQVAKRVQARKNLRAVKRRGSALVEAVLSLGALALIVSAALGANLLAGWGLGGLALLLWGCGLFVFCGALMRWAPALESEAPPFAGYEGQCPLQPFEGETAAAFQARLRASRPGRK